MSALVIDSLTVVFGAFRALDGLSLAVDPGEVRAVIGPCLLYTSPSPRD